MKKNNLKKKAAVTLAGIGTFLGIFTASKYDDPIELMKEEIKKSDDNTIEEKVIVEKAQMKEYALDKLSVALRVAILVPMWLVGHLLLGLADKLFKTIGSPILVFLLSTLITFIVLLIIVVSFIKLLYPNIPLRKIITKKLLLVLLVCSLLMNIIDRILLKFVEEYVDIRKIIRFLLGLLMLISILFNVIRKKIREDKQPKIIYDEI